MKKIITIALAILTLAILLIFPVSAAKEDAPEAGSLSAVTYVERSTTRFTVEVSVNDNPGFIAVSALAEYDEKVLKLIAADNGDIFSNIYMPGQTLEQNPYKMLWMEATSTENITTNGVLARYTFEVVDDAPLGNTEIKFLIDDYSNVTLDTEKPAFAGCSVKVNVKGMSNTRPEEREDGKLAISNDGANATYRGDSTVVTRKPPSINGAPVSSMPEDFDPNTVSQSETDQRDKMDQSIIIIVSVVAILVAGAALTLVIIFLKKK